MGCLMFIGNYTDIFESSVNAWTTLGPLAIVVAISMSQDASSDVKRHRSDHETNNRICTVLRRSENVDEKLGRDEHIMGGEDVEVQILKLRGHPESNTVSNMNLMKQQSFSRTNLMVRSTSSDTHPRSNRTSHANSTTSAATPTSTSTSPPPQITTSNRTKKSNRNATYAKIAFSNIKQMNIRAGDIVLVKNRETIPADMILLGSSGENGAAYIETSPIDGETNLKLRNSPHVPAKSIQRSISQLRTSSSSSSPTSQRKGLGRPVMGHSRQSSMGSVEDSYTHPKFESIERAVKRLTRMSLLGHPHAKSSLFNPNNPPQDTQDPDNKNPSSQSELLVPPPFTKEKSFLRRQTSSLFSNILGKRKNAMPNEVLEDDEYVSTLITELPNASVNTFSGKICLPPTHTDEPSIYIPLNAENILLRGAMLRNTEWVLGVACFTGEDTKLARNSIQTETKFSGLEELMNRVVVLILILMAIFVLSLSALGYRRHVYGFDELWYAGFAEDDFVWPYMKINGLDVKPKMRNKPPPFHQFVFTYITLLNNLVPMSVYVTVEMINLFLSYLVGWDRDMYHEETDTPALARSNLITDLGQVRYVFSDKTGTLTQNVMRFKRCSVDGSVFGPPVVKGNIKDDEQEDLELDDLRSKYHELKQLLIGTISLRAEDDVNGTNNGNGGSNQGMQLVKSSSTTLTFNAEMFLRVMSICHTVVVEKEIDVSNIDNEDDGMGSIKNGSSGHSVSRSRNNTADAKGLSAIIETTSTEFKNIVGNMGDMENDGSFSVHEKGVNASNSYSELSSSEKLRKSDDGSPYGFAYQAESPDEGALVSAASLEFGFQLHSRDSDGVKLNCHTPSLLSIPEVVDGLKDGTVSPKLLASETASPHITNEPMSELRQAISNWTGNDMAQVDGPSEEIWSILAVNKFDSTRKRMSVLVRSPPELGSIPMILIKGADSSMLDPDVCVAGEYITSGALGGQRMNQIITPDPETADTEPGTEWEKSVLINMQSQLGIFASEGLRTLVLGVRVLSEMECADWLRKYNIAATAIENRDEQLTAVAKQIETQIHIVGSTAIEDKLQDKVPETIHNISRAGIKLWVLTGDKRETAIEIGYSTKVLDPKMYITDVADGEVSRIKALIAMEFIRLVKIGKLPAYQANAVKEKTSIFFPMFDCFKAIGKCFGAINRAYRRFVFTYIVTCFGLFRKDFSRRRLSIIDDEVSKLEQENQSRPKEVRALAERILEDYRRTEAYSNESQRSPLKTVRNLTKKASIEEEGENTPEVFHRASNANTYLDIQEGNLNAATVRALSLAAIESTPNVAENMELQPVIDDDVLSLSTVKNEQVNETFNKKKRSMLEKLFAVDRDVRKGRLIRHLTKQKRAELESDFDLLNQKSMDDGENDGTNFDVDRALVIEGAALVHFLGDPYLEELLFAVASSCESVIACRVSPKQKALLVKLVKQFVNPTPVTVAIGDGANDVGMIQEAQVGIGISGLEGQQAVNSSDFAIAQFRFLEDLLLVHGRWNFMRLSKAVLFSFYKNAVLAGLLVVYSSLAYFSGEPLFDSWALSMFNFVNGWGILILGMFDRDVDKDYVKENPSLYAAGPDNEHMALRVIFRWIFLTFLHVNIIFFMANECFISGGGGGGMTSAFKGMMQGRATPGDGEGSDLKVFGTLVFIILNFVLSFKVLYESGAIINGQWPALLGCRKNSEEGFYSRVAYTWHAMIWLCILFNFSFLYIYQVRNKNVID